MQIVQVISVDQWCTFSIPVKDMSPISEDPKIKCSLIVCPTKKKRIDEILRAEPRPVAEYPFNRYTGYNNRVCFVAFVVVRSLR